MAEEPCGFHAPAEGALKLATAEMPFLLAAKQINGLKPNVQLDMAGLKNGPHADGEGLAAGVALVQADAGCFAFEGSAIVHDPAVRADAPERPQPSFDVGEGGFFTMEMIGGKSGLHGVFLRESSPISWGWGCQV